MLSLMTTSFFCLRRVVSIFASVDPTPFACFARNPSLDTRIKTHVTYACQIDLLRILRATLALMKAADYPEKGDPRTEKVANCIREAICELEVSVRTATNEQPRN